MSALRTEAVAQGHAWFDNLASGRAKSVNESAARAGLAPRYVSRLLDLAFLPPKLVEAVLEGTQSADIAPRRDSSS